MTEGLDFNQFLFGMPKNSKNKVDDIVSSNVAGTKVKLTQNKSEFLNIKNILEPRIADFVEKGQDNGENFNEKILEYKGIESYENDSDNNEFEIGDFLKINELKDVNYDYKINLGNFDGLSKIKQLQNIKMFDNNIIDYYEELKKKSNARDSKFIEYINNFLNNIKNFNDDDFVDKEEFDSKKKHLEIEHNTKIQVENNNVKQYDDNDYIVNLDLEKADNIIDNINIVENTSVISNVIHNENTLSKISNQDEFNLKNTNEIIDNKDEKIENDAGVIFNEENFDTNKNLQNLKAIHNNDELSSNNEQIDKIDLKNIDYKKFEDIDNDCLRLYYTFNDNKNNIEFLDEDLLALSKKEEEIKALQRQKQEEFNFDMEALTDDENNVKIDLTGILDIDEDIK